MKCPVCGKEGSENLVVVTDKKEFLLCCYDHAMIFLQECFRLRQVAWLKERNFKNNLTIFFDEVEVID